MACSQFRISSMSLVPGMAIGMMAMALTTTAANAHAASAGSDPQESCEPFGPPAPDQPDQPESRGVSDERPLVTGQIDRVVDQDPRRTTYHADDGSSLSPSAFDECRFPDAGTGESVLDADCAFGLLQRRYQSLRDHRERGELLEEIDLGDSVVRRTETKVDCTVRDGRFAVTTTARRIRTFFGRMVPIRSGPGPRDAARELDRWLVPHAVLDRDGTGGLGPASADDVVVDERSLIRLELEGAGDRVELFVNPETVLVERALGERALPDGGRWRGQLDIEVVGSVAAFAPEPAADARRFRQDRDTATDATDLATNDDESRGADEPTSTPAPVAEDAVRAPAFGG